jgi:hypothetical protein
MPVCAALRCKLAPSWIGSSFAGSGLCRSSPLRATIALLRFCYAPRQRSDGVARTGSQACMAHATRSWQGRAMSRRAKPGRPPRQTPYKRTYASGRTVWIARYLDLDGRARYAKPRWNGGKASFALRADAQRVIDEALERLFGTAQLPERVGEYFEAWQQMHPRSQQTDKTNRDRISYVLGVEIEGRPLGDWEFDELRRRQALALVDHMFRVEGRAAKGARGILSALSAMAEDAIGDDVATHNAFMGIRLRRNDPRVKKPARKPRIWSFEQMREFAVGGRPEVRAVTKRPSDGRNTGRYQAKERVYSAEDYEALILTPGFTGLRLGEFLALKRSGFDGQMLIVESSAHEGSWSARARRRITSGRSPYRRPSPS